MEFSKRDNTFFSYLSPKEKEDLIKDIKSTYISLRHSLRLPKNATFGLEVEYDSLFQDEVDSFVYSKIPSWYPTDEYSLNFGGEVTSPVLIDKFSSWADLAMLCSFLRVKGAVASERVGSHVHVGVPNTLGDNTTSWVNFVKKWMIYEDVILRFTNGESVTPRASYDIFCDLIALELYDMFLNIEGEIDLDKLRSVLPNQKFQSVNFNNVKWNRLTDNTIFNTIEFRTPNGTFEEAIWQNNVNFFVNFLLSCNEEQDEEYFKYMMDKLLYVYSYRDYYKLDIEKAIRLADDIFDNELDKVYFLRQYIKDEEEIPGKGLNLTKPFVNTK